MSFPTTIQALIGTHTPSGTGQNQCAVDWGRNNVFIAGSVSGTNYISSVGLISGTEQAYKGIDSYTPPTFGHVTGTPVGVDGNGNPYLAWIGLNGGGLLQLDETTLAQLAIGGNTSDPPGGFTIASGVLSCIAKGGTQFMLGQSQGGSISGQRQLVVWNEVTFAGRYEAFGPGLTDAAGVSCPGVPGTGIGFVAAGPENSGVTQNVIVSTVEAAPGGTWNVGDWPTQNTLVTNTVLVTLVPTDIDPAWTQIYVVAICVDQTDGNILLWVSNHTSDDSVIVKLDASSGAILWNCPVPAANAIIREFSFSNITRQRLAILTPSPNTISIINTSDGSRTFYTDALDGLSVQGPQAYNDVLGGILCVVDRTLNAGGPTSLNSTPDDFAGWAMLYVAAPPAGSSEDGWFTVCKPFQLVGPVPPPPSPVPPTPPTPPTPPPDEDYRVTMNGDIRVTTTGDTRILL